MSRTEAAARRATLQGRGAGSSDLPIRWRSTPRAAEEALRRDRVDALAALLVRTRHAEDVGPLGPGVVRGAGGGRPRQELELVDGERALAVHGAEAVGARVASADDDDALALGRDEFLVGDQVTLAALVLERQVFHREVDAPKLAPGHRQVSRPAGTARPDDRVEVSTQSLDRHVDAHV